VPINDGQWPGQAWGRQARPVACLTTVLPREVRDLRSGVKPLRRSCAGAILRNNSGPALHADSLQVGQDMYLRGGFTATGGGLMWRSI
jgi:hypothetical protein